MSTPVWVGYIVIVGSICGIVARMIYASSGPPDDKRYCVKCHKTTSWHPDKGCEHCAWCERQ